MYLADGCFIVCKLRLHKAVFANRKMSRWDSASRNEYTIVCCLLLARHDLQLLVQLLHATGGR